jgi:subtilase family protein
VIDRFVAALRETELELDWRDIADVLWLADAQARNVASASGEPPADGEPAPTEPTANSREAGGTATSDAAAAPPVAEPTGRQEVPPVRPADWRLTERVNADSSGGAGLEAVAPTFYALPGGMEIGRALRPMKQRRRTRRRKVFDPEATVDLFCDTGVLTPVLSAGLERWFDVAIVTDTSATMAVWDDTVAALADLLERHGAFRGVTQWGLTERDGAIEVLSRSGLAYRPHELLDLAGRRLVLVVTDAVDALWDRAPVWDALRAWGEYGPVALVQVLPPRSWPQTRLGEADAAVTASRPGQPNFSLEVIPPWWWAEGEPPDHAVPVVGLEEASLSPWARMVMGAPGVSVPAVLAVPEDGIDDAASGPAGRPGEVDLNQLGNVLRSTVSAQAYRLAVLLSAVEVSLPIARIVMHELMPQARLGHLAELIAAGVLKAAREPAPGAASADVAVGAPPPAAAPSGGADRSQVALTFAPGLRELLQRSLTVTMTLQVWRTVAPYLEATHGLRRFSLLLQQPPHAQLDAMAGADELREGLRAITTDLADRLGLVTSPARPAGGGPSSAVSPDTEDHAQDAGTAGPAGAVRVSEANPLRLGVHRAISLSRFPDEVPPEYVPRDVDTAESGIRARVAAAAQQGGFVVLVGGSAAGATRSAVEAVKASLPDWWLVQPAGSAEVAALASDPPPRTVVWLDELRRYLDEEDGLTGGVVRTLLNAPHPVVIIGTLWPDRYAFYTAIPAAGGADTHTREREVLDLAEVIRVGAEFSPAEQARARAAAARDPRLRMALETADYGLTQTLAATPQLVARWVKAPTPQEWAVLTAALDAVRLGAHAPLSADFLRAAAPGYLRTFQPRAEAPENWFEQAMVYATSKLHGGVAALRPVGTDTGEIVGYIAADYLVQYASRERGDTRVPASTWDAILSYVQDAADAARLADSASRERLDRYAIPLYRRAADAGDEAAASQLARLLAEPGPAEESEPGPAEESEPGLEAEPTPVVAEDIPQGLPRFQTRLILDDLYGAAAFPATEQPADADSAGYLYREQAILVRRPDAERVAAALGQILADTGDADVPGGDAREITVEEVSRGLVRLAVPPTRPLVPYLVDRLDAALGRGLATPDHVLSLRPAVEPWEVPDGLPPDPGRSGESYAGDGPLVGVLDTGLLQDAAQHDWLRGVVGSVDGPSGPSGEILPTSGHGTFVAGVLRCLAPNASVYVERGFDVAGANYESNLAGSLESVLDRDPDILVLTFASSTRRDLSPYAFEDLYDRRIRQRKELVVLAPAGDDGWSRPTWPAASSWAVSVGALGADRRGRASFSNHGTWVDVFAPGEDFVNAYATGTYVCTEPPYVGQIRSFYGMARWSGTALSAALVAGLIAARMSRTGEDGRLAADSLLRAAQVRAIPGVGPVLLPGETAAQSSG